MTISAHDIGFRGVVVDVVENVIGEVDEAGNVGNATVV